LSNGVNLAAVSLKVIIERRSIGLNRWIIYINVLFTNDIFSPCIDPLLSITQNTSREGPDFGPFYSSSNSLISNILSVLIETINGIFYD